MSRKLFGTDGIRGTVGQHPITPDLVLRLGHAVGRVLKRHEPNPVVLIGKDTRISGYMLESALESGLNSAGASVVLLGPVPTPAPRPRPLILSCPAVLVSRIRPGTVATRGPPLALPA